MEITAHMVDRYARYCEEMGDTDDGAAGFILIARHANGEYLFPGNFPAAEILQRANTLRKAYAERQA